MSPSFCYNTFRLTNQTYHYLESSHPPSDSCDVQWNATLQGCERTTVIINIIIHHVNRLEISECFYIFWRSMRFWNPSFEPFSQWVGFISLVEVYLILSNLIPLLKVRGWNCSLLKISEVKISKTHFVSSDGTPYFSVDTLIKDASEKCYDLPYVCYYSVQV